MVGVAAAVVSYQVTAHAGNKSTVVVTITVGGVGTSVKGSLGSARNSANNTERIGCTTFSMTTAPTFIVCEAKNSAGLVRACDSNDVDIIAAAGNMAGDALVQWDQPTMGPGFPCDPFIYEHGSNLAPKVN
jgi:hypothetical protein